MGLAMDTEHSAAYQLLGINGCLLITAMLWAPAFRGKFSIQRHLPRFATVGQPLAYSVLVRNETERPQRALVLLEDLRDARLSYAEFKESEWSVRWSRGRQPKTSRRVAKCRETPLPAISKRGSFSIR